MSSDGQKLIAADNVTMCLHQYFFAQQLRAARASSIVQESFGFDSHARLSGMSLEQTQAANRPTPHYFALWDEQSSAKDFINCK